MTVDVKGNSPLWMKVKDLAEGVTYRFRIRAKTFAYGPDVEANITTGPGEGTGDTWGTHGVREGMGWGLARPWAGLCPPAPALPWSSGAPGPPGEPFISRYGSAITIHWSSGDPGQGPITRYVIEARPSGTRALHPLLGGHHRGKLRLTWLGGVRTRCLGCCPCADP